MLHPEAVDPPGPGATWRRVALRALVLSLGLGLGTALPTHAEPVHRQQVTSHPQAPFPYRPPVSLGFSEETFRRLGDQVETWVGEGTVVGAEVLVVKSGQIAWHEVFGVPLVA